MILVKANRQPMDKVIAFIGGDLVVTLTIMLAGIWADFALFGVKVVATLILGAAGGIAGMFAKDAYPKIKQFLKRKRTKTIRHD